MAQQIRVDMNSAGADAVLKSAEVQAELQRRADRVAAAAGDGHSVRVFVGRDRARAHITTVSAQAKRAEMKDRNLTRSLDAARGD